jgi:Cys-tRNA(Pro)/Cys-tRNA(Cys) deacylase
VISVAAAISPPSRRPGNLRRVAGKGTPAIALLTGQRAAFTTHEYDADPNAASYGLAAAAALGADPARVFKTLVATVDGRPAVGVVPVSASLDLKALAAALDGKRAAMAEPAAAERATGYVTGGISPFGHRTRLPIVVDTSIEDWPTVFVSGGRRGLQLEVGPADLIRLTDAVLAPIATP